MKRLLFSLFLGISTFAMDIPYMEDQVGIPEVAQREYILVASGQYEYIQTYGMYTCVGLVMHNEQKDLTVLAHVDAATNLERELPRVLKSIGSGSRISLIGGTQRLAKKIQVTLEKLGERVSLRIPEIENIIVSTSNGEIFEYDESRRTTPWAVGKAKIDRLHFGGSRLYRHMDSIGGGDYIEVNQDSSNQFDFNSFL